MKQDKCLATFELYKLKPAIITPGKVGKQNRMLLQKLLIVVGVVLLHNVLSSSARVHHLMVGNVAIRFSIN